MLKKKKLMLFPVSILISIDFSIYIYIYKSAQKYAICRIFQITNESCYFPFFSECNQRIKIIPRRHFIGYV